MFSCVMPYWNIWEIFYISFSYNLKIIDDLIKGFCFFKASTINHCRLKYNTNVTASGITSMKIIIAVIHVMGLSLSMKPKKAFRFLFI